MNCFSKSYTEAREKFLKLAGECGSELVSYQHPEAQGFHGEDLYLDVAVFGEASTKNKLVFTTGVHGLEGLVASAVVFSWLQEGWHLRLPQDTAAVILHAVNPWGVSHFRRTNENNVDLNRNFMDFPHEGKNPLYQKLHSMICTEEWGEEIASHCLEQMEVFSQEHGMPALIDTIMRGQYTHPQGIEFGGTKQEWSTKTVLSVLNEKVLPAQKVFYVDWHTGLGEYGKTFFIHDYGESDPETERLAKYFGEQIKNQGDAFAGGKRPEYNGVLISQMRKIFEGAGAEALGMVVEFGTKDNVNLKKSLLLDRWLNTGGRDLPVKEAQVYHRELLDDFYPEDSKWKKSVLSESQKLFSKIDKLLKE